MAGTPRGRFGWDELFTSDPGAAEGQYRTVMGWTTELGGTVAVGPEDVPGGGRIAQCTDPQGAAFAVHHGPDA